MSDDTRESNGADGVIYLVATPIGNLEDITLRALRILREADLIACEDTRRTGRLLRHFAIKKPLVSCHEHNEHGRARHLVARALDGESVALVTDAGTPAISDPGFRLVREALDAGVSVVSIPGPTAAIAALVASGLPTDKFYFEGFLPPKRLKRQEAVRTIARMEGTTVCYEAPHRILETLKDIGELLGDRRLVVARELTKLHEEYLRGTATSIREELAGRNSVKGEFVLLIGPSGGTCAEPEESLATRVSSLQSQGKSRMEAIKHAARERGLTKREAYSQLLGSPRQPQSGRTESD